MNHTSKVLYDVYIKDIRDDDESYFGAYSSVPKAKKNLEEYLKVYGELVTHVWIINHDTHELVY